jgi:16S rRNA (cytidine1402-2'-O)-methyltransferase
MPLILVPTPLGNLRDMTVRGLDALRECDLIVAEDTRVARKLLNALALPGKEIWSYREQNAAGATAGILERARTQNVVVTTDAGMPGISDPGTELVAAARREGVAVDVLPGASAALGVAVLSGFDLRRFVFEGFPPRASGARKDAFRTAFGTAATTLWYESPQRILATLRDLAAVAPDARVFLVREYTKMHEQQILGTAAAVAAALPDPIRGEIAFAVAPQEPAQAPAPAGVDVAIDRLLAEGVPVADIARSLAERGLGERRNLYARAVERKHAQRESAGHKG